ncbi:MAG: hypothetical protein A2X79_04255 [Desulfuromonadaceae bacterium GWB2_53_15]|nr:MAG: hypothetical protein A2X83_06425 [Desulfuromonadales bacterium GWD2_54_10]OHB32568.1 MAG: hypothetical protein A2X79_04255 [Desulfuromonadaceae bacterium GWB2_53_15]
MTPAFNKGQEFLFIPPGWISAFNQVWHFAEETVSQFLIFETLLVASAAISGDLVYIVGRYIPAADITVVLVFSVKRTDGLH